jgi:hypothetical protein
MSVVSEDSIETQLAEGVQSIDTQPAEGAQSIDTQPAGGARSIDTQPAEGAQADEETVDGLPVLAEVRPLQRPAPVTVPAVQAAAVAATGFVAGAATLALIHRRGARKLARTQRAAPRRALDLMPVVGTRTFLVDVHLLAKPGE